MQSQRAFVPTLLAVVLTAPLAGCAGGTGPAEVTAEVTGVPASWLEETAEGWPGSDAYGGSIPVLTRDDCLLGDVIPQVLGESPEDTDSGWGAYGDDPAATGAYRYVCNFWADGRYAGSLQLIQAEDPATAAETLELFMNPVDIPEQDHTVSTVQVGQLEVHVVATWFPTNPQGQYQALHVDTAKNALVVLEVNSLDEADYAEYSDEQVAEDLLTALSVGG